jgi:hypothetical protein
MGAWLLVFGGIIDQIKESINQSITEFTIQFSLFLIWTQT